MATVKPLVQFAEIWVATLLGSQPVLGVVHDAGVVVVRDITTGRGAR